MNYKNGQVDNPVIFFAVLVVGLIFFAPITLHLFNTMKSSVGPALGNVTNGGAVAKQNFDGVMTPLTNMWDKVIISAFFLAIILLFVSAFLIDVHPFWVVLYIFSGFMMFLFIPQVLTAADNIYGSSVFSADVNQLSFMDGLRQNFGIFLVGIFIITGIIIYGKVAFFNSNPGGGR